MENIQLMVIISSSILFVGVIGLITVFWYLNSKKQALLNKST